MDILSSQANLAGYKAVIDSTAEYKKAIPMMMTAAGTIAPAKIFIMGVGVAGLQAIATARRLGGIVTATDVRPATKEQVESLGAKFIAVEDEEFKAAETAAGYAKEMSKEYQEKQSQLVSEHIKNQDIVITTALIPGRKAPILITKKMVETMKEGSVIADLATERGGNVEIAQPGKATCHTRRAANVYDYFLLPPCLARLADEIRSVRMNTRPHTPVRLTFQPISASVRFLTYGKPPQLPTSCPFGPRATGNRKICHLRRRPSITRCVVHDWVTRWRRKVLTVSLRTLPSGRLRFSLML